MRVALTLVAPLVVLLVGCAGGGEQPVLSPQAVEAAKELETGAIDGVRLKNHLLLFADRVDAEISGTGTVIASRTTDAVVQAQSIQWRIEFIPLMFIAVREPDPRAGFLEAWTACVRMQRYFEDGDGKNWFGDQQQLAIDCARRLTGDIVTVGKQFFPEGAIEKARKDVEGFALDIPIGETAGASISRSTYATKPGGGLRSILESPVTGLLVGDTPSAIVHASQTAAQIGQVVRALPEQSRWQMQLLLLELQSMQTVAEVRRDFNRVSESIASIAATAETLPQDVQNQVAKTLEEASTTIKEVDTALTTADKVVTSIDETSKTLRETAVALKATAETIEAIIENANSGETAPEGSSSDNNTMTELLKTSEQLHATAVELRGLIGDLESDKLAGVLDKVSQTSESTIDYALKRIAVTALLLLAALVVAQAFYRLVVTKLIKPAP